MPTVPTYDNPQVDARPLPNARVESVATPGFLGGAADRLTKLGTGAANAGTHLNDVAFKMQEQENLRAVQDATTEYGNRVLEYQTALKRDKTGVAAQGAVGEFSDWHKKQLDDIVGKLGNDAQRRAFTVMARKNGLAVRHDVATFEINETRKANAAAYEAGVANNIGMGATAVTPEAVATFKANIVNSTKAFAASNNLAPEVEQALLAKSLTDFHAQRIQQLAAKQPDQAAAYFEANKHEIKGDKQAEIGKFAEMATAEITAVRAGGEIFTKVGPQGGLDVMEDEARKRYEKEPAVLKLVIANLRERTQAFDKGQQERVDATAGKLSLAALNGATPGQLRAMPEFMALAAMGGVGARKAGEIINHAQRELEHKASLAASYSARANAEEERQQRALTRKMMGAYLSYSDPDVLARLSRDQVVNLLPVLGNELTSHLVQRKDALGKSESKVIEARIDKQDFDHIAQRAGLKPFDPHKSESERADLGELQFTVEQRINAEQVARKRALTRDEKMSIMQQVIDNKVMVDRPIIWDKEVRADQLTPSEAARAYVVVNGREIRLSSISAAERAEITRGLQARNMPVSEQAIARVWAAAKAQGRK